MQTCLFQLLQIKKPSPFRKRNWAAFIGTQLQKVSTIVTDTLSPCSHGHTVKVMAFYHSHIDAFHIDVPQGIIQTRQDIYVCWRDILHLVHDGKRWYL